jgi:hypothetical protein
LEGGCLGSWRPTTISPSKSTARHSRKGSGKRSPPPRWGGPSPGSSAEIAVAYFDGAELQPWPEPQRYTYLKTDDGGATYRFVSLDGGFSADLLVDQDGLVLDYPGLFRRVFPWPRFPRKPLLSTG